MPFDDVHDDIFGERIILFAVFLDLADLLQEEVGFLFFSNHLHDIPPGDNPQFGEQCLDQLHVGVVHAIKYDRIHILENIYSFNHLSLFDIGAQI